MELYTQLKTKIRLLYIQLRRPFLFSISVSLFSINICFHFARLNGGLIFIFYNLWNRSVQNRSCISFFHFFLIKTEWAYVFILVKQAKHNAILMKSMLRTFFLSMHLNLLQVLMLSHRPIVVFINIQLSHIILCVSVSISLSCSYYLCRASNVLNQRK